ncbi:MAG: isoprenyl transferase [Paludibacteraceae bacterium]|nr:isoprenyl transferase [Paludibacteraceae bacterium]MBP5742657.1 isoprenyl transferase [Paludibacteraceae bacterium]
MTYKEQINKERLPQHIAIIMDGNGRWAMERGMDRTEGHKNAIEAVRDSITGAAEIGVKYLTLYTFSTENWNRPEKEVHALMALLVDSIEKETPTMNKNNVRFKTIGDLSRMPKPVLDKLNGCIENTSKNTGLTLILALSYSARWEITDTVKNLCAKAAKNELNIDEINEETISKALTTSEFPDPDLMIRTGGELRISNFLLWQLAYSELYFTDLYWPDFRKEDLYKAIVNYQNRQRRFGLTEAQVSE